MSSDEKDNGSNWLLTVLAAIFVLGDMTIAEYRYQPESLAESVVGYFLLPGDLLVSTWSDKSFHPRDFIASATGQEVPGPTGAELARRADDETLEGLVEQFGLQPGNVFYDELERRRQLKDE